MKGVRLTDRRVSLVFLFPFCFNEPTRLLVGTTSKSSPIWKLRSLVRSISLSSIHRTLLTSLARCVFSRPLSMGIPPSRFFLRSLHPRYHSRQPRSPSCWKRERRFHPFEAFETRREGEASRPFSRSFVSLTPSPSVSLRFTKDYPIPISSVSWEAWTSCCLPSPLLDPVSLSLHFDD